MEQSQNGSNNSRQFIMSQIYSLVVEQNTKYNSVTGPLLHLDMSSIIVLPENGQSRLQ
jgi:hypothetical protein